MALQLNQAAPDFTLYDTAKKQISLHDYMAEAVVILFFSVCIFQYMHQGAM